MSSGNLRFGILHGNAPSKPNLQVHIHQDHSLEPKIIHCVNPGTRVTVFKEVDNIPGPRSPFPPDIECFHRAMKHLCRISRFMVSTTEAIRTHIFCSFTQLELIRAVRVACLPLGNRESYAAML